MVIVTKSHAVRMHNTVSVLIPDTRLESSAETSVGMLCSDTGLLVCVFSNLSLGALDWLLVALATSNLHSVLGTTLGVRLTREMGITSPFCNATMVCKKKK